MANASRSTQAVAVLALITALPPFVFLLAAILFTSGTSTPAGTVIMLVWWAIVGCVGGVVGALWLAAQHRAAWLLLLVPAFANGFFAFVGALGVGMARMH